MCSLQPELHGFVPVVRGTVFGELQRSATSWPNGLRQCIAVCNSLNLVNKHRLAGENADYEAFRSCEARFMVRDIC